MNSRSVWSRNKWYKCRTYSFVRVLPTRMRVTYSIEKNDVKQLLPNSSLCLNRVGAKHVRLSNFLDQILCPLKSWTARVNVLYLQIDHISPVNKLLIYFGIYDVEKDLINLLTFSSCLHWMYSIFRQIPHVFVYINQLIFHCNCLNSCYSVDCMRIKSLFEMVIMKTCCTCLCLCLIQVGPS